MNIKKAADEDTSQLLKLLERQFHEHDIPVDSGKLGTAIRRLIKQEGLGFILTANEEDQMIGCAVISFAWTLEHGGRTAWLDELYILPEFRGAGIGAHLLDQVCVEAEAEGCRAIDLEVDREHHRAENLYQRKGFVKLQRNRWVKRLL